MRFVLNLGDAMFRAMLCLAVLLAVALPLVAQAVPTPLDAYEGLKAAIRPTEEERAYLGIPWRTTLRAAVEEGRRLDRPVLLWTMNGHPLGCT